MTRTSILTTGSEQEFVHPTVIVVGPTAEAKGSFRDKQSPAKVCPTVAKSRKESRNRRCFIMFET